jgi:CheY-like chemotaxis protein
MIAPLREQLANEGELITFADSEPIQALQTILERRPELIVLERLFAATPRGAALINRIKTDPELAHAEIRVMSHTGDYTRQITTRASAPVAAGVAEVKAPAAAAPVDVVSTPAAEVSRAVDWHGTRRAPRVRVKKGVEIQLDGNAVTLVDVSSVGAQVVSATVLRPNQKVRVTIPKGSSSVRYRAAIAWAKFELRKAPAAPVYRAGIEFLDADPAVVTEFAKANKE